MNVINRNRSRLGIKSKRLAKKEAHNKSPILLDSPKTRQSISPGIDESGCSTPISTRKRSCFYEEESPSQDCDSFSPHYAYCSQEVHNLSEVVWQWNSPKRQIDEQKKKLEMKEKWLSKKLHIKADVKKKPKSPTPALATGFYKFQQELQNIKLSAKILTNNENKDITNSNNYENINKNCDESIDMDKNVNIFENTDNEYRAPPSLSLSTTTSSLDALNDNTQHSNNEEEKKSTSDSSSVNNFLDDSDLDLFLLQCSQQAEDKLINDMKPLNECISRLQVIKESPQMINDSFDELFNKIPLNEILDEQVITLTKCSDKTNSDTSIKGLSSGYETISSNDNTTTATTTATTTTTNNNNNKAQFTRHNSMPESPGDKISTYSNSFRKKNLSRHFSMPPHESQNILSTNESVKKRCTKEEIERKRLIALEQRLKSYNTKPYFLTNQILINNNDNIKRNLYINNNKFNNDKK